ncbi:ArsR/SmtB family transcription factor [Streptomyces sp. NPDC058371]|uniref:ArsR/SmtB family transcription factor n=1 Tax=Streptomyces sp. NPDC058371 TaxID=3346463 RepID=UPI0036666667
MNDTPTSPPPPRDAPPASADLTESEPHPAADLAESHPRPATELTEAAQGERPPAPDLAEPLQEVLEITTPEQFAALAHPLRQRLLFSLGHRPATISGLAARLGVGKGNVAHHLKVLRTAGLVRVAATRKVRGGTEQHYQRLARRMLVAEPQAAGTAALLGAVAQELDHSPGDPLLTLRQLRLSPERARQLADKLAELVDGAEEDAEGEAVHGVLVAMYEHAPAGGAGSD